MSDNQFWKRVKVGQVWRLERLGGLAEFYLILEVPMLCAEDRDRERAFVLTMDGRRIEYNIWNITEYLTLIHEPTP